MEGRGAYFAFAGSLTAQITELKNDSSSFSSGHVSTLEEMKESLTSFALRQYEQTGLTPAKSVPSFPRKIAKTRADEEIIAQHRNDNVPLKFFERMFLSEGSLIFSGPPSPVKEELPSPIAFPELEEVTPEPQEEKPIARNLSKQVAKPPARAPTKPQLSTTKSVSSVSQSQAKTTSSASASTRLPQRTASTRTGPVQPGKENDTTASNLVKKISVAVKPPIRQASTTAVKKPATRTAVNSK